MRFRVTEEKIYNRVILLRELIGEQEIYGEPCELLVNNLNELEVLIEKLHLELIKLRESVEERIA